MLAEKTSTARYLSAKLLHWLGNILVAVGVKNSRREYMFKASNIRCVLPSRM